MRKALTIVLCLAYFLTCKAQESEDIIARMNEVKLDASFIYGTCALRDSIESRNEALADLVQRVDSFLKAEGYRFVQECPNSSVRYLVYTKGPDYWRTLAYVEKNDLKELEQQLQEKFEAEGIESALDSLKNSLFAASTITEIDRLIDESRVSDRVQTCEYSFNIESWLRDRGYLFFYNRTSGKVLEVWTPLDENGVRLDARTRIPATSRVVPPIRWVYFDEPQIPTKR